MSEITSPIMLDDTGQDLVTEAQNIVTKLQALINAVKPTAADIPLAAISGMTADDVQEGVEELNSKLVKYKDVTKLMSASASQYYGYYYYDIPISDLQLPNNSTILSVFITSVGVNLPCIAQIANNTVVRINSITSAIDGVNVTIRIAYI